MNSALALAMIVALALTLRFAWLAVTDTQTPPLSDPQYYSATAQNIAEGRGYSVAFDQRGFVAGDQSEATAFWAPGYPIALAPIYRLTDSDERAAKVLNAIAGALTVLPIFYVARRLVPGDRGEILGLISATFFAVLPSLIFWTPALFSEPLFTFGVAMTLATALWAPRRRSIAAYVATGIVLAATAFVRSQGMALLVPVLIIVAPPTLRPAPIARVIAPLLAGIALLIVPWAVRNEIAMGRPFPINDNLGYNLRLAHGPYSNGTSVAPRDLWDERPGISFRDRELFFADVGTPRALTYAHTHPARELHLAALRIGWLLRSDAAPSMQWSESLGATPVRRGHDALVLVGDIYWYVLLALVALSPFAVRRDRLDARLWLALWSTIGVWLALHLIFAGEPRYHVPLTPVLAIIAASTIATRLPSSRISRIETDGIESSTPEPARTTG